METTKTLDNYTVSVRSDELGYYLSIQENINGKFGKAEKVFIPRSKGEGLDVEDLLEMGLEYINMKDQIPAAPTVQPTVAEKPKTKVVEAMETGMDRKLLLKYGGIACCFMLGLFFGSSIAGKPEGAYADMESLNYLSKEWKKMTPEQQDALLEEVIGTAREERETVYTNCVAMCEAERSKYDGKITEMKAHKETIRLEQAAKDIVRTVSDK